MTGAFQHAVAEFGGREIPVIPTRSKVPSKPMVRNPEALGLRASRSLSQNERYRNANAGVWCGPKSGLTIVDIDDASEMALDAAIERFGESKIIARTPSGGWHLYFKHNGERRSIRPFGAECELDVLGSGLAVVPPSVRLQSDDKPGGEYRLVKGDFSDLEHLQTIRVIKPPKTPEPSQRPSIGQRNDALFALLRMEAIKGYDFHTLIDVGEAFNADLAVPLSSAEIEKTVNSVLRYRENGRLFVPGGEANTSISASELSALGGDGDALLMLAKLRLVHSGRNTRFALAKAAAQQTFGWSLQRFYKARTKLTEMNLIICVHPGGNGANDPPIYELNKGYDSLPQYNYTPSLYPFAGSKTGLGLHQPAHRKRS